MVKRVGGVLAAAFTARAVVQFGKESVKAFTEAEAIWNRLGGTLAATGVQFGRVRGQIEGAARAMQDVTTVGDEDFAATLQTLVRITGDYQSSLKEVQTVANLAAGAQISLSTAATLVGKVMVGETGTLKRYGIVVKDGADAMQALRDRFKGLAENEAMTLAGQMKRLNNEWGDFKEAIGKAVVGGADGVDVLKRLADRVKEVAEAIDRHSPAIQSFLTDVKEIISLAEKPIVFTVQVVGDAIASVAETIREFKETGRIRQRTFEEFARRNGVGGPPKTSLGAGGTWERPAVAMPEVVEPDDAVAAAAEATADALTNMRKAADDLKGSLADLFIRSREQRRFGGIGGAFGQQEMLRLRSIEPPDLGRKTAAASLTKGMIQDNIPDGGGFLAQTFGGLKTQVMGLASAFGPLAVAVAVFKPIFEGLMSALGPALTALMVPLNNFGFLIGSVITPALELLTPVLEIVSMAFAKVIQGIGWLIRGVGDLLNKLPGSIGNPLKKFGQEMIDAAKAAGKHTDTTLEATEALVSMTSSMSNVPSVFANALRRFQSSTTGVGIPPPAALVVASATGTAGSQHGGQSLAFNGPITVIANNPEEFARQMEDYGAKVEWRAGYSRFAIAVG